MYTAHIIVCQDMTPTYGPPLTNFIFSFWKLPLKKGWESENPMHTVLMVPVICEIVIGTYASWVHTILKHLPTLSGDSGSVCLMLVQTASGHTQIKKGSWAAAQCPLHKNALRIPTRPTFMHVKEVLQLGNRALYALVYLGYNSIWMWVLWLLFPI